VSIKGEIEVNAMNFFVWMLPIIFMLHDFEEIIMAEVWSKRYSKAINSIWPKRQPFGLKYIQYCQTPAFSIGVAAEFVLFSLISLFSVIFQNYFVWYGAFLALIFHFVFIHMLLCLRFKNYVPGIITSAIFVLPSVWLMNEATIMLHYELREILLAGLLGIALILIVFPVLHKSMGPWSKWLYTYQTQG
jgi:Protein of unknown function with HXXEE motif